MRNNLLFTLAVLLFSFVANASDTLIMPTRLNFQSAHEMQDNYDGWFRNHKNTDGMIIEADKLAELAQKYPGKKLGIVYGRRLQKEKDHGHRVTLILVVYATPPAGGTARVAPDQHEYYDLGDIASAILCPPPRGCNAFGLEH